VNSLLPQQESMQILLVLETLQSTSNPSTRICVTTCSCSSACREGHLLMIDDGAWCWCETPPNRLPGTLYWCGGLWLGFTLARGKAGAGWFCKLPLSLWKDSSPLFTLVWD
jgi:hypothetical protein